MSSLLDVLHKRAPHPAEPPGAAAEDGADPQPEDTVELALVPETQYARRAAPAQETRGPAELPADAGGEPAPAHQGSEFHTGEFGSTSQLRRWTDVAPCEAVPQPAAASPRQPVAGKRLPFVMTIAALLVVAAAFVLWRLTATPEPGFLAEPGEVLPPPEADAATGPAPEAVMVQAPPPAETQVAPPAKAPAAAVITSPAKQVEPVVWYDLPALPEEPGPAADAPLIEITRETIHDPAFATVRKAYDALLSGDAARAETLYREVLAAQPGNVDALLGLGSLAARAGRADEAREHYLAVRRLDPRNATALAALSALPGAAAGNGNESRLKTMLREQPSAAALHFALGLHYVSEQRWSDAQVSFFEAVRHDPVNADYAFNLAVSLDRLGQVQAASSYYQRALDLARGSQQFDPAAVRARLGILRPGQG